MKNGDVLFWIWLSEALGQCSRSFRRLIELYENPYDLFHAEEAEIERIPGLSDRVRAELCNKSLSEASDILDRCEKLGIGLLPYGDEAYPYSLRDLHEPPILLYYKGNLPDLNRRLCIGMVGTRRMSAYGLRAAYKLGYELALLGAIVVSGMAAGIDGVSAAAALAANGSTLAVLGCGVDVVYPSHHAPLYREIEQKGVLISEYPPGTRPSSYHFPIRNRIISGLAQGTLVVEAGIKSGSLITAKDAVVQGRDVYALPANVGNSGSEGTNSLLRDGAKPILCAADIVSNYEYVYAETLSPEALAKGKEKSEADMPYLESLGVITLSEKNGKATNQTERYPTAAIRTSPERKAQRRGQTAVKEPSLSQTKEQSMPASQRESQPTPSQILASLTPIQLAVLEMIPDDRAIAADSLAALGYPYGETVAALTMLEIMGLIQKLPGALYKKA